MKHGPFDPTKKAADGLSNMPAGYYDIYTASFTLDGVEYEVLAQLAGGGGSYQNRGIRHQYAMQ